MYFIQFSGSGNGLKNKSDEPDFLVSKMASNGWRAGFSDSLWGGVTGTISVSTDKFLCLSIPYMKGWKAYVDGEEVTLYQANTAFMGVELPAGEHVVSLRYWIPGLTAGLIMSGIGVVCLIVIIVFSRRRQ